MKWFPISLPSLEKFCLLAIVFLTTIPPSVMAIVWLKFYLTVISRNMLKSMDAVAVSGTYASQPSVLFAESLVIVPQPAHSLVAAGAVISPAMWPGSVRRLGALCFLFLVLLIFSIETELPATTASVIVPVNTTSIADVAVSTAVITTAATVSTVPATVPSTSVNSSAAPVSTSCSTVTATAAATDSTCSVSTVASVPSTSDASSAFVSKSKSPRPVISAKSFRTHLEKNYTSFEIPSFDNVTGKEWDSRARAYIKQQVQSMFVDKRIKLTNGDLVTWTELEVYECSLEILSHIVFQELSYGLYSYIC